MKRVIIVLLSLLMTLCLAGCGSKEDTPKTDDSEKITVNGKTYNFRAETHLLDMHFKENYVDFHTDQMGDLYMMSLNEGDNFVFQIRVGATSGHSVEEISEMLGISPVSKKINDLEYRYGEYKFVFNEADEYDAHIYMHEYNGLLYSAIFIINGDIADLETKFMNSVYFKTE